MLDKTWTNRHRFSNIYSIFYILIDNNISHHSGQNVVDSRGAAATICILPRYRHEISDQLTRAAFSVLLVANWPIYCDITSSFGMRICWDIYMTAKYQHVRPLYTTGNYCAIKDSYLANLLQNLSLIQALGVFLYKLFFTKSLNSVR